MNARKSTAFLYFLGKLNPKAWDAIIPHGPKISRAGREYLIAHALKGFAAELENRAVVSKLTRVQTRLVESAAQSLVADWDDDGWCGTIPRLPFPWPGPTPGPDPEPYPWRSAFSDVMLNPQPLPPKERQREIAGYLLMLSEVTSLDDVATELQSIGNNLLGIRSGAPTRSDVPLPSGRGRNLRTALAEAGI
jgi:hypothetical protein